MKRRIFLLVITCILLCLVVVDSYAQRKSKYEKRKQRFNAGLILGLNFSQIDGDHFHGYDKSGLRMGIKRMFYLDEVFDITTGVSYVQRGSRFENAQEALAGDNSFRKIHLDYIEIPVFITYKLHKTMGRMYRIDFGGSFSRLFNSQITETIRPFIRQVSYASYEDQFLKNEINLMTAITYFFTRKIGFGLQYTHQLNHLYYDPNYEAKAGNWGRGTNDVKYMKNFQFGVQLTFHLD